MNSHHYRWGKIQQISKIQELVDINSYDFLEWWHASKSKKLFDFGADPDHDWDPGIFKWNFNHCNLGHYCRQPH